jgi:hypothetical protein
MELILLASKFNGTNWNDNSWYYGNEFSFSFFDFENAFKSLQKISGEYTNNPVFYFNMLECAMGFNFNVAIENGYKFFKLAVIFFIE